MDNTLISVETAKLANEKGFKEFNYARYCYHNNELKYWGSITGKYDDYILAPTQSLLQCWLRDVHNLHICIHPEFYTTGINYCIQVLCYAPELEDCENHDKCTFMHGDNGEYPTYEDALEFGLELALNLIK